MARRTRFPTTLYFLILFTVFGVGLFLYANNLIHRVESEYRAVSIAYADATSAIISSPNIPTEVTEEVIESLKNLLEFPAIVITSGGELATARFLPEPLQEKVDDWLHSGELDDTTKRMIFDLAARMDEENEPIPLVERKTHQASGTTHEREVAQLHYAMPYIIQTLNWTPIFGIGFVLLFAVLGLLAARHYQHTEQQAIWVGLAKETAHQLGTPLSSLLGWVEILRERPDQLTEVIKEISSDIGRLEEITHRFGEIGSKPEMTALPLKPEIEKALDYCRRRISLNRIRLEGELRDVPPTPINGPLIGWVVENLVRNSAQALSAWQRGSRRIDGSSQTSVQETPPGLIRVELRPASRGVELIVSDNGPGMDKHTRRHAFDAGQTTKARGWGLGLTLVKRIVDEYHGGKIRLESTPEQGTRVIIFLPATK